VWSKDLRLLQTVPYSPSQAAGTRPQEGSNAQHIPWPTDAHLQSSGSQHRLFVSSNDRLISLFRILPAEFDPDRPDERNCVARVGAVRLPLAVGPATCLATLPKTDRGENSMSSQSTKSGTYMGETQEDESLLVVGDGKGGVSCISSNAMVHLFLGGDQHASCENTSQTPPSPSRRVLHTAHSDAVTRILHVPRLGLISSSLDATMKIFDPGRGTVTATSSIHRGPVRCMAFDPALSLIVR